MTRVLVTGASGFLGTHLVDELLSAGYRVRGFDLMPSARTHPDLEWVEGSFLHEGLLSSAIEDCEIVFHLASTTLPKSSNDDPQFDVSSNLQGSIAMLDQSVANDVRKFIYISSGGTVYGVPEQVPVLESNATDPTCSYGIVKLAVEKYLYLYSQLHNLDTVSLRLSNPYGEYQRADTGQGVIAAFVHKSLNSQPIEIWGDGSVMRDFIYVGDAVRAMLSAIDADCGGKPINIGYGSGLSINAVIDHIERVGGLEVKREYRPGREFDVPAIYLDISEAKRTLGWSPDVSLDQGLERLFTWARSQR